MAMQWPKKAVQLLYPPQCMSCGVPTDDDPALCPDCWSDTHFLAGLCCDACGTPLVGAGDGVEFCDTCTQRPPPWKQGRAVALYSGPMRRMVMALKHGDRHDIARSVVPWLAGQARELCRPDTLIVPVPLHWTRLLRRRFNQAALLAQHLGAALGCPVDPDLLRRVRATAAQEDMSREDRFENQAHAFDVDGAKTARLKGRPILLVDDVMTTGATLTGCADTCLRAGASRVDSVVLARVAWDI